MQNSRDTTFDIYDVLNFDAYSDSNIDEKHKKYEKALKKYCSYFSDIDTFLAVGTFSLSHLTLFSCNELLRLCCQLQWARLEKAINQFSI